MSDMRQRNGRGWFEMKQKKKWGVFLGVFLIGLLLLFLLFSHDSFGCNFRCGKGNWGCINECQWWDVDTTYPYKYQNQWDWFGSVKK